MVNGGAQHPFQGEVIIKLFAKINEQYFSAYPELYLTPPDVGFVTEELINSKVNPDHDLKLCFWLWRIQRYFLVSDKNTSSNSKKNTVLLIDHFLKELEYVPDEIKKYLCLNEQALNCLIISLLLNKNKMSWDGVLQLITQYNEQAVLLPMLHWCYALYFEAAAPSCDEVLIQLLSRSIDKSGFNLPVSPITTLFQHFALCQWYEKNPQSNPTSLLRVLLPQGDNSYVVTVLPHVIKLGISAEVFSNNEPSIKKLSQSVVKLFLLQFRGPKNTLRHSLAYFNTYQFKLFLNYFIILAFQDMEQLDQTEYLVGFSQAIRFYDLDLFDYFPLIYKRGILLVQKLFLAGQYLEAYELYADIVIFASGDDSKERVDARSALYCFVARIDQWLEGSDERPKFNNRELALIPELKTLHTHIPANEIPKKHLYLLAKRLGERFQFSKDDLTRSLCSNNYLRISSSLTEDHKKEVNVLFQCSDRKKNLKADKNIVHKKKLEQPSAITIETAHEPKATAKPEPKATAKPEPKAAAKPELKATAKPEPKATSKPEPKATAKPEPKVAPKPEPKAIPKPEPKAIPKPAPKPKVIAKPTQESKPGFKSDLTSLPQRDIKSEDQQLEDGSWPKLNSVVNQLKKTKPDLKRTSLTFFTSEAINSALQSQLIIQKSMSMNVHSEEVLRPVAKNQMINRNRIPERVMHLIDGFQSRLPGAKLYLTGAAPSNILDGKKPNDYDILVINSTLQTISAFLKEQQLKPEIRSVKHPILFCDIGDGITLDFTAITMTPTDTVQNILKADFEVRDFNFNALYCEFTKETEFPVFSFADALEKRNTRIISTIKKPVMTFKQDPTRLFRLAKLLINHPKEVLENGLREALHDLSGKWMALFREYIKEDTRNINRLNHAINKLFSRHQYVEINQVLQKMGGLIELSDNSYTVVELACSKIPPIIRAEHKFLYWVFANILQGYELGKGYRLCPTQSLLVLNSLEKDCLEFIYDKAPGRIPEVSVYVSEFRMLVDGFKLPNAIEEPNQLMKT